MGTANVVRSFTLSSPKVHECECSEPGHCKRHGINKTESWWKLCQTREAYRVLWDEGRGAGERVGESKRDRTRAPDSGPGTELTWLLGKFKIFGGSCSCKAHARKMDQWGPDECLVRMDTILGWLESEAKKRHLPFVRIAAKTMVKLAVRRARLALKRTGDSGDNASLPNIEVNHG